MTESKFGVNWDPASPANAGLRKSTDQRRLEAGKRLILEVLGGLGSRRAEIGPQKGTIFKRMRAHRAGTPNADPPPRRPDRAFAIRTHALRSQLGYGSETFAPRASLAIREITPSPSRVSSLRTAFDFLSPISPSTTTPFLRRN